MSDGRIEIRLSVSWSYLCVIVSAFHLAQPDPAYGRISTAETTESPRNSPSYCLLRFRLMSKFIYRMSLSVLLHTPQDVSALWSAGAANATLLTHLRSRTAMPAFFMRAPFIFHSSSHDSGDSFVSAERPIALRKSSGDVMDSMTVGRRRGGDDVGRTPLSGGIGRNAALLTNERVSGGMANEHSREPEAKQLSSMSGEKNQVNTKNAAEHVISTASATKQILVTAVRAGAPVTDLTVLVTQYCTVATDHRLVLEQIGATSWSNYRNYSYSSS